jgi:hypothetical protein
MIMLRLVLSCLALLCAAAQAQDGRALIARHAALQNQLADNPFGRPLHVDSTADGGRHQGEIHAVLDQPHGVVAAALAAPAHWCEILTLQVNVKGCRVSGQALATFITRKARDSLDDAHRVDFRFQVAAARSDYLHVVLSSADGPVGTRDYEIRLQATPLDARRTFVHLSYAYTLGFFARLAMDAYLAGAGRDKVGFSVVERQPDGRPVYVDGMRGVLERSAMRYYLAVEATVEALAVPPAQRLDARTRSWYAAITSYPQLREQVGADEYVEMKRREATAAATSGTSAPWREPPLHARSQR